MSATGARAAAAANGDGTPPPRGAGATGAGGAAAGAAGAPTDRGIAVRAFTYGAQRGSAVPAPGGHEGPLQVGAAPAPPGIPGLAIGVDSRWARAACRVWYSCIFACAFAAAVASPDSAAMAASS